MLLFLTEIRTAVPSRVRNFCLSAGPRCSLHDVCTSLFLIPVTCSSLHTLSLCFLLLPLLQSACCRAVLLEHQHPALCGMEVAVVVVASSVLILMRSSSNRVLSTLGTCVVLSEAFMSLSVAWSSCTEAQYLVCAFPSVWELCCPLASELDIQVCWSQPPQKPYLPQEAQPAQHFVTVLLI